jgi:tetratricopeptide (TPR) repeat protein
LRLKAADNKEYISIEIAEKYYIESLRLFNLLCCHKDVALLHFKLANLYVRAATYEKSIVHFEKSLVASRVLSGSNSSSVTEIYLNLGIAHDAMHSFDKAAHCYDFCIEHSSDSLTAIKARISKGRALSKIERFEEALQCLSDALSTHNDTQPNIEADILVAKGQVADLMNNNRLAMKSYFSALEIFRTLPRLELDVAKTLMEIANSHLRHKRYEEASSFASEAFEM